MSDPKQCPVCGDRQVILTPSTHSELRRFACERGHVFYVPKIPEAVRASS